MRLPRSCKRCRDLAPLLWEGELPSAEAREVAAHLKECAPCRKDAEGLARALDLAASLPRLEPSMSFLHTLERRVDRQEAGLEPRRRFTPFGDLVAALRGAFARPVTAWAGAATVLALVVGLGADRLPLLAGRDAPPATGAGDGRLATPRGELWLNTIDGDEAGVTEYFLPRVQPVSLAPGVAGDLPRVGASAPPTREIPRVGGELDGWTTTRNAAPRVQLVTF